MAEVAEPRELVHGNESRSLVGTDGSVAGWGLVAQGCESTRTNEARTMTEDDDLPAHYRVRDPHIFLNRAKRIAPHRGKFRHLGRAKEQRERLSAEEARRELREQLLACERTSTRVSRPRSRPTMRTLKSRPQAKGFSSTLRTWPGPHLSRGPQPGIGQQNWATSRPPAIGKSPAQFGAAGRGRLGCLRCGS